MSALARIGDTSNHGGTIISGATNSFCDGIGIARAGDLHSCPVHGHGVTALTPIAIKAKVNGRLVITVGASAGCGAIINSGSPTSDWS